MAFPGGIVSIAKLPVSLARCLRHSDTDGAPPPSLLPPAHCGPWHRTACARNPRTRTRATSGVAPRGVRRSGRHLPYHLGSLFFFLAFSFGCVYRIEFHPFSFSLFFSPPCNNKKKETKQQTNKQAKPVQPPVFLFNSARARTCSGDSSLRPTTLLQRRRGCLLAEEAGRGTGSTAATAYKCA